jgi:metal-responsive CopG/Arc/MetJ family transcriptional regulator
MIKQRIGASKGTILVEFKVPKELVKLFDSRLRLSFSNRSEALRALMRSFVEENSIAKNPVERS